MKGLNKNNLKTAIKKTHHYSKAPFWFLVGFSIASLTLISIVIIYFQTTYKDKAIPGIFIENAYVGEMTQKQIENIYDEKNLKIKDSAFVFTYNEKAATISAQSLQIGYNSKLMAEQAIHLGKSSNIFANFFLIINSYLNGTVIHNSYSYHDEKLIQLLAPVQKDIFLPPVDALFNVEDNKVTAFKQSENGRDVDMNKVKKFIEDRVPVMIKEERAQNFVLEIPLLVTEPDVTTEEANSFGIVEEIGTGNSRFHHSIPNRVHNVALAASRVNGILVKPGEEFSFVKYLGDVSKYTGYAQAYIISGGKTILGDGGGVCQVSTTLFRAILNAGLPITERRAHAYRVGYYEEDSPPGIDATVFYPSVDLKFKNDTGNYILIQSYINEEDRALSYVLYGKKDGREVTLTTPITTGYSPPPEPVYQDDPTLPKGVTNQIDFAAAGATVVFNRTVKKEGKIIIDEKFVSRYAPWRAVFLVGTKES